MLNYFQTRGDKQYMENMENSPYKTNNPEHDEIDLLQYWQVIWRRKWLVIMTIGLVTALAVAITLVFMTPKYESTAELLQRRIGVDKAFLGTDVFSDVALQPDRDIQTAANLVTSLEVIARVNEQLGDRLGGTSAEKLINASVVDKVDIMEITAIDANATLAADVANTFANEYIKWRTESDQQALTRARAPVENQINAIPESMRGTPSYQSLVDKLNALKLAEAMQVGNLQLVKPAAPGLSPVSPKPVRNGAIGFITSIFLGVGLVFFLDRFDTKIRSVSEITARIDKPILASIPTEPKLDGRIVTIGHPKESNAEAYRLLKANLSYVSPDDKAKTIMITSPGPVEGKTTTTANLAVTLARAGKSVTILEFDFRRPSLAKRLGLNGDIGVTNVIAGTHSLEDVLQVIQAKDLAVEGESSRGESTAQPSSVANGVRDIFCVMSGPIPPNPGELAASDAVCAIIDTAAGFSDYILVDTPPLGVVGDAASLASRVDGMILVIRMAQTDKKVFISTTDILRHVPCNLLGVVITDVDAGDSYGYGYGGGYYKYGYST